MDVRTRARLLAHMIRWRLNWKRRDTLDSFRVTDNPKFMGVRDAVRLIKDGSVLVTSGLAGNLRASYVWWAMAELYKETGAPRDLTVISVGGQGARDRAPGSVEELGVDGLSTRLFCGHSETYKSFLRLADTGKLELQILLQGTMTLLIKGQGQGNSSITNQCGVGCFIDPRVGRGTPLTEGPTQQYVEVVDDGLKYTLPKIDVAVFNAPAADRRGNIYAKKAAMIAESYEAAKAAKRNGGIVIANVAEYVDEGYGDIFLPADDIDAIVLWRKTEQSASITYRKYWDFLSLDSKTSTDEGIAQVQFVNGMAGYTPRRKSIDTVLARLAATLFVRHAGKGAYTDIGVGLPEEVSRVLFESGAMKQVTLLNESGVFGGLPAPGIFFGAAVNPEEIISSAEAFERIYKRLDAAILGVLQADSEGNVNVSKRGDGAINYVGPGGFMDLTLNAKTVIFCSAWGNQAKVAVKHGKVRIKKRGRAKFVDRVDEVTFSGKEALKQGKQVFYVTHLGAFRLTDRGMELVVSMPGVDIQRDIIDSVSMKVVLPEDGNVEIAAPEIVTGRGFRLSFDEG